MIASTRRPVSAASLSRNSRLIAAATTLLAIAGCATASSWTKAGKTPDQISQDLSICRQNMPPSITRSNAIESDIMATRGNDLQKLGLLRTVREGDEGRDRDVTEVLIEQCMTSKGYTRGAPN